MESRKELAASRKACGSHNCTQAVCCTYHDFTGLDEDTLKQAGNCFAAGMGNMEGTCGAIVGAGIVYGLAIHDKAKAIKGMRQIMENLSSATGAPNAKCLRELTQGKCFVPAPYVCPMPQSFLKSCLNKMLSNKTRWRN